MYTWCALDTLVYPAMLGRPARVESACHATGVPVRVEVEPGRVVSVDRATAVVSLVTCTDRISVRASFCDQVHFFAGEPAAGGCLDQHPGAVLLPVAEAQRVAAPLIEPLPVTDRRSGCCPMPADGPRPTTSAPET